MMRMRGVSSLLCMVLLLAGAHAQRMPANSFLVRPALTTEQLVNQVAGNAVVMDRYMRHYGMSRDEVIAYFRTFRPSRLAEEGIYQIYSVPGDGVIKVRIARLPRNEPIFVDAMGTPVMQISCGNPLTLGPSYPVLTTAVDLEPIVMEPDLRPIEAPLEAARLEDMVYVTQLEPTAPTAPAVVVTPPDRPIIIETPGAEPAPFAPPPAFPWLLAGLPLLGLGWSPGGGAPIPEPATMLALGVGVGALVLRRRRK
jgi:hypothetical protein